MTRPKKYATKAEAKQAQAAARLRHYNRNRDEINADRRDKYCRQKRTKAKRALKGAKAAAGGPSQTRRAERDVDMRGKAEREQDYRVEAALGQARTLPKELSNITAGSSRAFFDRVCESHFSDLAFHGRKATLEVLRSHLAKFQAIADKLRPWQRTVWEEKGCSKEWKEMEEIRRDIEQHISWMSEIEVFADVLPKDLPDEYEKQGLEYQRQLRE
ncbi:hypothetical protein MD484_g5798, partial [Candolleomyces efflorescens]